MQNAEEGVGSQGNPIDELELEIEGEIQSIDGEKNPWLSYGVRLYLLCLFSGSAMTAVSKYVMREVEPEFVMFSRMLGTFMPSLIWLWYRNEPGLFLGKPGVRLMLWTRGSVGALNIACTYYVIQHMSLPNFATLNFLCPLLTAIAAHVVLKESYYWQQATASLLAIAGVVVIARPAFIFKYQENTSPDPLLPWAIFIEFVQIAGTVVVLILLRKLGTKVHPLASVGTYSFQVVIYSSGRLVVMALNRPIRLPTTMKHWELLGVTGFAGFVYQYLLSKSFSLEEASILTQFDYVGILYATAWEYFYFGDVPDILSLTGTALILTSVFWSAKVKRDMASGKF